jgi:hypothetical protein
MQCLLLNVAAYMIGVAARCRTFARATNRKTLPVSTSLVSRVVFECPHAGDREHRCECIGLAHHTDAYRSMSADRSKRHKMSRMLHAMKSID